MTRYKIKISYSGTLFFGSQVQPFKRTVEGVLLDAISVIAKDVDRIFFSGRTDSGVHALGQIVHFDTSFALDERRFVYQINAVLPKDLKVIALNLVGSDFHARHSALAREYQYMFTFSNNVPIFLSDVVAGVRCDLDVDYLKKIFFFYKEYFLSNGGVHDFSFFSKINKTSNFSTRRKVFYLDIFLMKREAVYVGFKPLLYCVRIIANSFLYGMVRGMVGALFVLLKGKYCRRSFLKYAVSGGGDFRFAFAPSKGLSLTKVYYDYSF